MICRDPREAALKRLALQKEGRWSLAEVKDSDRRCCVNPKVFDLFSHHFFASPPTIAPMFAGTDMARQQSLLRQGVPMMVMHLGVNSVGATGIHRMGESHSKTHLNIHPNLCDDWINVWGNAGKDCDDQLIPALEAEWRTTWRQGVDRVVSHCGK